MIAFCVETVLHLQPHTLEVSFATLQLFYQLCADPACPIPQQSGVVVRRYPLCLSCKLVLAVSPRFCSRLGLDRGLLVGHKFGGMKSDVSTFRSSTAGVSVLGRTNHHFVDPDVKVGSVLSTHITYERSSVRY